MALSAGKKAVYTGSFDPITMGHIDIVTRIALLYDEVTVLVSHSVNKQALFSVEERKGLIQEALHGLSNIRVASWDGLVVDYMRQEGAEVIVRGLRAVVDFEYEMAMASMNKKLAPDIETVLVFASPEFYYVSSRGVKEVARFGGDLTGLVPKNVALALKRELFETKL